MRTPTKELSASGPVNWLRMLGRLFSGSGEHRDNFRQAILTNIKPYVALDEPTTGRWYATAEAANWNGDPKQIAVRFLVSRQPRASTVEYSSESLRRPGHIRRDFRSEQERGSDIVLFFNFTRLLPVVKNLERFREFAIAQIKDLQLAPPGSAVEEVREAKGAESLVLGARSR